MDVLAAEAEPPQSIALCLSGGGLRATFFHLGVITALREAGLLAKVKEVFSVSGGSITAGHLALNWSRYTGTNKEFEAACTELRAIGSWDIRNRVVRRWVLGSLFFLPYLAGIGRTELLQRQYEKIFKKKTLRECAEINPQSPKFYILSTSFNTGDLCSFCDEFFTIHNESTGDDGEALSSRPTYFPADNVRLSLAIAASSAFPPLFPPLRLTWDKIGAKSDGAFNAIALTDGGVYDNLGFDKLAALDLDQSRASIDMVLVSDAGGAFNASLRNDFSGVFARNVRATDVLMRRTSKATLSRMRQMRGQRSVLYVPIGQTSGNSAALITTQTRLQNIRTDLDGFSRTEVAMLVEHGRDIARDTLAQGGFGPLSGPQQPPSRPAPSARELAEATAREGSVTRIGLFDSRDWASYALVVATMLGLAILYFLYLFVYGEMFERIRSYHYARFRDEESAKLAAATPKSQAEVLIDLSATTGGDSAPPMTIQGSKPQAPAPDLPRRPVDIAGYKVWIQFAGNLTREQMKAFGNRLLAEGWKAPGAEQGGERTARAANLNEIRYNPATGEKAAARLADDVNKTGIVATKVTLKPVAIIPPNSLEIWISN